MGPLPCCVVQASENFLKGFLGKHGLKLQNQTLFLPIFVNCLLSTGDREENGLDRNHQEEEEKDQCNSIKMSSPGDPHTCSPEPRVHLQGVSG